MEQTLIDSYLTVGAGGVCLLLIVWTLVYQQKNIMPKLEKLENANHVTNEILRNTNEMLSKSIDVISKNQSVIEGNQKSIENNTEAIKNFSNVLQDFSASITTYNDKLERLQIESRETSEKVTIMNEKLK